MDMSGLDVLLQTAMSIKKLNLLKQKQVEYLLDESEERRRQQLSNKGTLKKNTVFGNDDAFIHHMFDQSFIRNQESMPTAKEVDKPFNKLKRVTIVTPVFAPAENAIISAPKHTPKPDIHPTPTPTPTVLKPILKVSKRNVITQTIAKIQQKETNTIPIPKQDIVTQTTEIIKVSEEQLKDVHKLLQEMKDIKEKQRKLQDKYNKRLERLTTKKHHNKKRKRAEKKELVASLSKLNKTLQVMYKNHVSKPKVPYKSVSSCFTQYHWERSDARTQSSCYDLIYQNSKFPLPETKESLKDAKKKLNDKDKPPKDFKTIPEPNYEYEDDISLIESDSDLKIFQEAEKKVESKLAHMESNKVQKFISVRQQICDVDRVCDELENLLYRPDMPLNNVAPKIINNSVQTDESGDDLNCSQKSQQRLMKMKNPFTKPNMACGDDTKVENCLKKSTYLMREMNQMQSRSKIRMLSDNGLITREILRVSDEALDKQEENLNHLMENLSVVMKSSFYRPDLKEF